jgi:N-acetylglutamate synthase-like GNAT family acetyltransferase
MIRPVLYVDLPGIIYAIDRRARSKQHEFANFVCWLEPVESNLPPPPILRNIIPLNPASRTWICEDHWRILGFVQVCERPSHIAWDMSYLASMVHRNVSNDEVLSALLEYTLEMAAGHGILRIFAKVEDGIPELELFQRAGFQRYARELTYVYEPGTTTLQPEPPLPSLRRWNRHYVWGLHQLYRSVAPQRVQMAELLESSEEYAKLHVGSQRSFISFFTKDNENYVCDMGVRLGAWLRLSRGHGSAPHRIFLCVHPEHADLAEPLLRFAIRRLRETDVRRIYCLVREYDSYVITALCNSGFEQVSTRVLLVRHMALMAMRQSTVPLLKQRAVYGLKGLGTVNSRQKTMR